MSWSAQVRETVGEIQGHLDEIAAQTAYTNQGIYLLCSVIGEIVQTSGQRLGTVRQLQQYVQHSPPASRLQVGFFTPLQVDAWLPY